MPDDKTIEDRVSRLEERVGLLEHEWQNIPELIEMRFRLTDSKIARLQTDMTVVKRDVAELKGGMDALPRVLAEMLDERDKRR